MPYVSRFLPEVTLTLEHCGAALTICGPSCLPLDGWRGVRLCVRPKLGRLQPPGCPSSSKPTAWSPSGNLTGGDGNEAHTDALSPPAMWIPWSAQQGTAVVAEGCRGLIDRFLADRLTGQGGALVPQKAPTAEIRKGGRPGWLSVRRRAAG